MDIVNIIVHDSDTGIISLDSLGILDSESRNDVIKSAEELFIKKCVELKFGVGYTDTKETDDFSEGINETALDDGYFDVNGVTVSLVHSSIENVQL